MGIFQKRSQKEKFAYHNEGAKRILAKTKGIGMSANEKDARSAGYMAHVRESERKYVWANATEAEREAMKKLRNEKDKKKLWALEKVVKARAKAERAAKAAPAANAQGKKK